MELECKMQEAAYNENVNDSKTVEMPQKDTAQEREFWLSVKYSDEHRESER